MTTNRMSEQDQAVLVKYLVEAHGKERQLETALQAQIALASHPAAKHALSQHLSVTRRQIDALEDRIDALGGSDHGLIAGLTTAATTLVFTVANKGLALAKGPLQAARGTSPADNELRNLRDCYWNEAEEIAHYHVIETVARQLGDAETVQLAERHRKEEEQMQRTLEGLLPGLVREVVATETDHHEAKPTPTRPTPAASKPRATTKASTAARAKPTPKRKPAAATKTGAAPAKA